MLSGKAIVASHKFLLSIWRTVHPNTLKSKFAALSPVDVIIVLRYLQGYHHIALFKSIILILITKCDVVRKVDKWDNLSTE